MVKQHIYPTESRKENSHYLKSFFILGILFILLYSVPLWAEVKATTDRTVISIDETITLNIQSRNGSGSPDLSVLKKDFQILGQSQSQNYSFINGHASSTQSWTITLLPKTTGELIIPPIKVGKESTNPVPLVVQKQSTTPALDGKEVFLKLELSNEDTVYVQQQILVRVQLFHRVRLANATLTELELDNTVVEKLGNDRNYSKVIGKYRYNVIERQYAIYPQQSGQLTIPPLTFSGNKEMGQNFSLFSRPGRQMISRTRPVTINVQPIPDTYTGKYWLPAESITLESEILEDPTTIKAGEAITRHIIIRATGLLGSQLPAMTMSASADYKTYPDKEKLNNQLVNGKVIGTRRDTIAIIPLHAGEFTLPEIKVTWWNTLTNHQETAVLPAKTLKALPNADIQSVTPKPTAPHPITQPKVKPVESQPTSNKVKITEKVVIEEPPFNQNKWFWISMLLTLLWLITLILWLRARNTESVKTATPPETPLESYEPYLQAVYKACLDNNADNTQQALIQWAKIYFHQPLLKGLSDIIALTHYQPLIQAINTLEASKYSSHAQAWTGKELEKALREFIAQEKQQQDKNNQEQALRALNP